ncbi:MAG: hypothetical protein HZA46_17865 [Planctomycetales bacterium]|nr:hypothetical protein [Planctomycetales bacterium]
MASRGQMTGMRGVYLVAAELSKQGLIASPTSRSAMGADILVTDQLCSRAWSVQVKTNAKTHSFWLLNKKTQETVSPTHVYVLVNLITRRDGETEEYFVVPSGVVAQRLKHDKSKAETSEWWAIYREKIAEYKDRWDIFAK